MPYLDVPNINLRTYYTINPRYEDLGMSIKSPAPESDDAIDPAKPTLVFNHAGTSSSNSFMHQFRDPRLREALNLVSFDSRYYGRTGGDPLDHFQTLEERADEFIAMVDALLGDRPFSYFGESFVGSHVGAYLAAKRPQQVKAMVLVSPSFVTDPPLVYETLNAEWRPACMANKDGNGDRSGRIPDEAMAVVGDYFFSGATHMKERQDAFLEQYQEINGDGQDMFRVDQLLFWFRREAPSPDVFAAVRCPVLLLGGSLDRTVSSEGSLEDWRDRFVSVPDEDKVLKTIEGGAHLLATTDSSLVSRFALTFLQRYKLA
ncbi:hypothetical protein JCM3775_005583 [Rhodotorula graminis]|uniref:Serine aminopeptidase S33 domain-containing protein n=1 Tax=Rhodotorula graminis (strain WP1) TaxID=578459 RepID=A0A194SDY7_RHOGW|nr:uncharacterized protein RHOBADRAFT_66025 [Rhodotorula graminis WP1]KPV77666.1 hypothetical protein RHOBADRAFT_66025 [Rhodotorula graminis WP1]